MPALAEPMNGVFRALADPTRREVLERLGRSPASVSELARPFDMALPSFVQHLRVLEECGLVTSQKSGRVRTCRIDPARLSLAEQWVGERRRMWERGLDRLGAFLDETAEEKK